MFTFLVLTCKSVPFLPHLVLKAPYGLFMVTPRTTWSFSPDKGLSKQDGVIRGRTCKLKQETQISCPL